MKKWLLILALALLGNTVALATTIPSNAGLGWNYEINLAACAERITALERLVEIRFLAVERAIDVAKKETDWRLVGMNEARESIRDIANRTVPRIEYDAALNRIDGDLKLLMKTKAEMEGKASQQALLLVLAVALSGMVFGIIGLVMRFLKI